MLPDARQAGGGQTIRGLLTRRDQRHAEVRRGSNTEVANHDSDVRQAPEAEVAGEARSERQQSIEAHRNKAAICARKGCCDDDAGSVKGHAL